MINVLKARVNRGQSVIGTFVQIGSPDVTEMLSRVGFDFLILDSEHAPLGFETLQQMMQAMSGAECTPIVRPPWNDIVQIKRILDIGAYGVLIPMVNSKEEAEKVVMACKYPPEGIRGYGPRRPMMIKGDEDYCNTANKELMIVVQIETEQAVENVDSILSVPGIDASYIGPYDLSLRLGLGVPPKWDNPTFLACLDRVLEASEKHGKASGIFTTMDTIEWALDKGFKFNTLDDADTFMIRGAKIALAKAHYSP